MKYLLIKDFKSSSFRIVVDTTESPIQRSKINQRRYYSGKKTAYCKVSGSNRQTKQFDY